MAVILTAAPRTRKARADFDAFMAEAVANAGNWVMLDTFVYETSGNVDTFTKRSVGLGVKGAEFTFTKALDGKGERIVTDRGNKGWFLCAHVPAPKAKRPAKAKAPKVVADEPVAEVVAPEVVEAAPEA